MTRTKAAGRRLRIQSARRATAGPRSPGAPGRTAWPSRPGPPRWPGGPAPGRRRARAPTPARGSAAGTAGKKRSDWLSQWRRSPARAIVSYQPASHPRSPACTRAATPGAEGWVRSTTKCARPSAPTTTTRATTNGRSASRSDSGTPLPDPPRRAPQPSPGPGASGEVVVGVRRRSRSVGGVTRATGQGPEGTYSVRFIGS